jgi:beta-galactosidase
MTRTIAIALVLSLAIPVLNAANNTPVTVTIVRQSPIETLSSNGTVSGVKEATIGTHLKLVSVAGSEVTLQDDQQICYRIAMSATDYTPAIDGSLNISRSQGAPSQTLAPGPTPPAPLKADRTLLNQGWKFLRLDTSSLNLGDDQAAPEFDDSSWETVSLPHTAHVEPLDASPMWQGICWYRLHLNSQPDWKGKKIFVDFDAAMSVADVWVNGQQITTHDGGYLPFSIDLTDKLRESDNVVAVRLDNRDNAQVPPGKPYKQLDFDWYSGLYRNVHLRVQNLIHITDPVEANKPASGGVFVTYPEATSDHATVQVQVHVANESPADETAGVRLDLQTLDGKTVATAQSDQASLPSGADHAFTTALSVDHPNLWDPAHPNLYQLVSTVIIRLAPVDSTTTRIGIRRISISADGGFQINGQRMFLRGCNRHQEYGYLGYALSDNAQYRDAVKIKSAGFDFIRLCHYPQSSAFLDACDQLGLIVMEPIPGWQFMGDDTFKQRSYRNCQDMIRRDRNHPCVALWETSLNETDMDKSFTGNMQTVAHAEYPGDQFFTAGWVDDFDVFLQARQSGGCHSYKNGNKACLISEYGDWEYHAPKETSSRQARADGEAALLRQLSNFQTAANDDVQTPAVGDGVWLMYDYSRGYDSALETSGVMDNLRMPKFSYYFYQSQRDADYPPIPNVATGPMVYIASWWTDKSPANICVVSNCEEVELTLNGRLISRNKPDKSGNSDHLAHPSFTFKTNGFSAGTLKATGYINGQEKAEYAVTTAGAAASIRLHADLSGRPLQADGADAIFIYADILDKDGNVVTGSTAPIAYSVQGSGKLIGATTISATAGSAGIILQAGLDPGSITVTASSEGLGSGSLAVNARKPSD